jgi:hypothetical protein
MNQPGVRFLMIAAIMLLGMTRGSCQNTIPEILDKGTLTEQIKYIEERTLIYENYRAIREDMFQKIKNNAVDSLNKAKSSIMGLVGLTGDLNYRIDSLKSSLNATKEELKEISRTKNSISVIGIQLDKIKYNSIMWTLVVSLVALLVIGYLTFKRNLSITFNTKKELKELREEFEEYRKKSRLEREKMSMDHFNAMKKLKGG